MPKAFCGFETLVESSVTSVSSVRKKNILRVRKNSAANCLCVISYRGCVLFLTE